MSYQTVPVPPAGWLAHPSAPGYFYNPAQPSQMVQVQAAPVPVAPPAPVAWLAHPSAPGWEYNPANPADMRQVSAAPVAAPAMAMPQVSGALPPPSYGDVDPGLAKHEAEKAARGKRGDEEVIYLDFPDLAKEVGSESKMNVRLLPPWSPVEKAAWVIGARHRLYAQMDPRYQDNWKSQFFFPECYEAHKSRGLGDCPVCGAVSECSTADNHDANEFGGDAKAQERHHWQGLHLDEPAKHFKQYTRDGQPVVDPATGQVLWIVQPGVVSISPSLGRKLLNLICEAPALTHPDRGVNVRLIKKRSARGSFPMNVEYDAIGDMGGPSPLDPQFRSVLGNLIDLREQCIRLRSKEDMDKIAQKIRERFGLVKHYSIPGGGPALPPGVPAVPTEVWERHPNNPAYEYNRATGAVRQAAPPALPPVPPAAPAYVPPAAPPVVPPVPPAVVAPAGVYAPPGGMPAMPAPPAAPPMVAPPPPVSMPPVPGYAPPPTLPGLPPPVAPGLASGHVVPPPYAPPGVVAAPQPGLPPLPALPDLPPMVGGPVGGPAMPPPPPVGAPGAPMTPAQIEAAIAASPTGTPF